MTTSDFGTTPLSDFGEEVMLGKFQIPKVLAFGTFATLAFALADSRAATDNTSSELIQPTICSVLTASDPNTAKICKVEPLSKGNKITLQLTTQTAPVEVGGYRVVTENYNGNYLTPVVEAMPGDIVAAHLENLLSPRMGSHEHGNMLQVDSDQNPTNLHYFHGGLVSPQNARPLDVSQGHGDNIYVRVKNGLDLNNKPFFFDFNVPIPGEEQLDARLLEGRGKIAHPSGLNWYHSHQHGISSDQVMGGMSGLLSVGDALANVKASCNEDPQAPPEKCENDTLVLRQSTDVRYAMLRDIPLQKISKAPEELGEGTADWAPQIRDFPPGSVCGVWNSQTSTLNTDDTTIRNGYCQRDKDSAWLFTINGQRFPTLTVGGRKNLLIRLGNLSANIGYWLELRNEADGTLLPLSILSLDGVVPARPVPPEESNKPIQSISVENLLLMPASRAEIYIRNDEEQHSTKQVYILSTKELAAGTKDVWPAIRLARIVLEPNDAQSEVKLSLNASIEKFPFVIGGKPQGVERAVLPDGCTRDLDPMHNEYRRVTFLDGGKTSDGRPAEWSVQTDIVRPILGQGLKKEREHPPANPIEETRVGPFPFEEYMQEDGLVNWAKKHVCIFMDHGTHQGSHKQLWVLFNATGSMHNFHIHQMKFRLASKNELEAIYGIAPPTPSHTCPDDTCTEPDIDFYDEKGVDVNKPGAHPIWHDTIAMPPVSRVFVIMSFDAEQQVGRYVYHCHILKHEDRGLMAPIEVWEPSIETVAQ